MITLGCLQAGCRIVLVSLFDPVIVLDLLEARRADRILGVPTMVVALLDAQEANPRDLSALKLVNCGGSMVAPELVRRVKALMGAKFSTVYGQTEYCPVITLLHSHCRANMSPQKTPNVWVQVESFPLTGSGKIQKFVLRDGFVAGDFIEL